MGATEGQHETNETKKCTKCGEPKPLELFARVYKGSEKRKPICNHCAAAYQRARKARIKAAVAEEQAEPAPAKEITASACRQDEGWIPANQLLLDFSCYPEVLKEIKRIAHHEERTPEVQARFML